MVSNQNCRLMAMLCTTKLSWMGSVRETFLVSTFTSTVANVVVEQGVSDPGAVVGKPIER